MSVLAIPQSILVEISNEMIFSAPQERPDRSPGYNPGKHGIAP